MLGINWTHNYNIRLYNNEEHIHIIFDDGHVETYKRLDNGIYAAPADRHNVLIADENGEFTLHFQTMEQYQFSQSGALSYIIDPNGHETALEYDGDNLTSVQTDCGKLSFSYNEDGRLSTVSDHTGRKVTYEYQKNQLAKATHPSGATFEYKYVGNGLISEQIDPLGIATVQNEYDKQGRTVTQRMANGGVSYLEYDDARMSTHVTEQNGNKIEYFRDSTYRTVRAAYTDFDERYIYDTENMRTGHVDRNKNTWWYEFDVHGNTTKKTDPLGNSVVAEYNVFNKPVKLSLQNGGHMGFTYDENGNLTSSIDPIGRVTSVKNDDNRFLQDLRFNALNAADSEQEALQYAIEMFIALREANNDDTVQRLGTFASMMPESRVSAGINQGLVDFTVMPFDFVPMTVRDEVVFEHPESMVATYMRFQWVAIWAMGGVLMLTLLSILVSHFNKKRKVG